MNRLKLVVYFLVTFYFSSYFCICFVSCGCCDFVLTLSISVQSQIFLIIRLQQTFVKGEILEGENRYWLRLKPYFYSCLDLAFTDIFILAHSPYQAFILTSNFLLSARPRICYKINPDSHITRSSARFRASGVVILTALSFLTSTCPFLPSCQSSVSSHRLHEAPEKRVQQHQFPRLANSARQRQVDVVGGR